MMSTMRIILFLIVFISAFSSPVFAHRVNIFCYWEGFTLLGEGYFSGGNPVKNSKIEIYDRETGVLIATAFTDEEGKFSLPLETTRDLKVVLLAGMGHRAECVVSSNKIAETKESGVTVTTHQEDVGVVDYKKIEGIVEEKIGPLREKIVSLEEKSKRPTVQSVLGGIGYIVGIFSLLYLLKKNAS